MLVFSTCQQSYNEPGRVEMQCEKVQCLVESDTIDRVNGQRNLGWRAANYTTFWGRALQDGKQYKLGTLEPRRTVSSAFLYENAADIGSMQMS